MVQSIEGAPRLVALGGVEPLARCTFLDTKKVKEEEAECRLPWALGCPVGPNGTMAVDDRRQLGGSSRWQVSL